MVSSANRVPPFLIRAVHEGSGRLEAPRQDPSYSTRRPPCPDLHGLAPPTLSMGSGAQETPFVRTAPHKRESPHPLSRGSSQLARLVCSSIAGTGGELCKRPE